MPRLATVAGTVAVAGAFLGALAGASPAESAGDAISLGAASGEIRSGESIALSGSLLAGSGTPEAGATVELQVDPFPYRGFFDAAHAITAADGAFAFPGLHPDRNTRYRVRAAAGQSRALQVYVDAPAVLRSRDAGPGRTILTMLSYHSGYFRWIGVPTFWYVAPLGSGRFHLAAITRTRELRPGVTYATATIDPPSRHFDFRVCFNGKAEAGTGPPPAHARCPRADFRVQVGR